MRLETSRLLEEMATRLTEDEVRRCVEDADSILESCGLTVEGDATLEEYAEALLAITPEDLPLDERAARKKAGILHKLGKTIKRGAFTLGKVFRAAGKSLDTVKKKFAANRARIRAAKGAFKDIGKAFSAGKRQKMKPGEKMVFGKVRKVRA